MKKVYLCIITFVIFSLFSFDVLAQAKKPRLVVIPSDALLNQMNLLGTTDDMGEINYVQNYKKAFLDTELKACISKIGEMFNDRGFPLTKLEEELGRAQGKNITIKADIRLELNYQIFKQGPRDVLYFQLEGVDVYSSKQIATSEGNSNPAIGATKVSLLQEAVMDKIDKFVNDIMSYFESMAESGRESRLTIEADGVELPFGLDDIVDLWLQQNCINGNFDMTESDETVIRVEQAMMPLFNANRQGMDARNFYKPLVRKLITEFPEFKISQKTSPRYSQSVGGGTLGDAYILFSAGQNN